MTDTTHNGPDREEDLFSSAGIPDKGPDPSLGAGTPPPAPGSPFVAFLRKAAGAVARFFTTLASPRFNPAMAIQPVSAFLEQSRQVLSPERYETFSRGCVRLGHACLLVCAAGSLVFWLTAAIRFRIPEYALFGLGFALLFPALQYTAARFLQTGRTLIFSSPSRMVSSAFPDCLALVVQLAGLIVFISFLTRRDWNFALAGCGVLIGSVAVAAVSLNPSMTSTTIAAGVAAGEEAVGILMFIAKLFMRIVPVLFGAGLLVQTLTFLGGLIRLFGGGGTEVIGEIALKHAAAFACVPFLAYGAFILYNLFLDVLKAILVIPAKLDRNRTGGGTDTR